jgi:hypothetical protein
MYWIMKDRHLAGEGNGDLLEFVRRGWSAGCDADAGKCQHGRGKP